MFSLIFGGLGEFTAPRADPTVELISLMKAREFDKALGLFRKHGLISIPVGKLDTKTGIAPIHLACAVGCMELLVEFLSHGAPISIQSIDGNFPLHFAAINSRKGICEILLRSGADPSLPNNAGKLAIELTEDSEIRNLLLRDKRDIIQSMLSPIGLVRNNIDAFITENPTMSMKELTSEFNLSNAPLGNPIHVQRQQQQQLEHQQEVDFNNSNDSFSNHEGDQEEDHLDEVKILVIQAAVQSAELEYSPRNMQDAIISIFACIEAHKHEELKGWLAANPHLAKTRAVIGCSKEIEDKGFTPLHWAAYHDNSEAMQLLLKQGEGVSCFYRDLKGRTAMHIAAERGNTQAVGYLKFAMAEERGYDPTGEGAPIDLAGQTPLGWAHFRSEEDGSSLSEEIGTLLYSPGDRSIIMDSPVPINDSNHYIEDEDNHDNNNDSNNNTSTFSSSSPQWDSSSIINTLSSPRPTNLRQSLEGNDDAKREGVNEHYHHHLHLRNQIENSPVAASPEMLQQILQSTVSPEATAARTDVRKQLIFE